MCRVSFARREKPVPGFRRGIPPAANDFFPDNVRERNREAYTRRDCVSDVYLMAGRDSWQSVKRLFILKIKGLRRFGYGMRVVGGSLDG
jgi:hypothetical protein